MNSQNNLNQLTKGIRLANQAKLTWFDLQEAKATAKAVNRKVSKLEEKLTFLQEEAHKIQIASWECTPKASPKGLKEISYENKPKQTFSKKEIKRLQILGAKLGWTYHPRS